MIVAALTVLSGGLVYLLFILVMRILSKIDIGRKGLATRIIRFLLALIDVQSVLKGFARYGKDGRLGRSEQAVCTDRSSRSSFCREAQYENVPGGND